MKNKIILIAVIILGLFLAVGCKKETSFEDICKQSMSSVNEANIVSEIYDGDILVYKVDIQSLVINTGDGYNSRIITKTSSLDNNMNLTETPKTEEFRGIDISKLFSLSLKKEYFSEYNQTETGLTGVIKASDAGKFLNTEVGNCSDITVSFLLEEGKLINYQLSFTLESGRNVNMSGNYYYE